jgi:hypothetical protein
VNRRFQTTNQIDGNSGEFPAINDTLLQLAAVHRDLDTCDSFCNPSRRRPLERLDQPAEPFPVDGPAQNGGVVFQRWFDLTRRQMISAGMRSLAVVIRDVLVHEMVQVALSERKEAIQRFLHDRLDKPLTSSVQILRAIRQQPHLHVLGPKNVVELPGELRVSVVEQMRRFLFTNGDMHH